MSDNISPCKYCGEMPEIIVNYTEKYPGGVYFNCTCPSCDLLFRMPTREDVIDVWNNYHHKENKLPCQKI